MAILQAREGDYYGGQESLLNSMSLLDERKEDDRYCLQSNYYQLGDISLQLKNYKDAIYYFDKALPYLSDTNFRLIALNSKALAFQKIGDYKSADSLYNSIIDLAKANPKEYARVLSNSARTKWLQQPSYNAAPDLLRALSIRDSLKDQMGMNASYSHLADYYTAKNPDSGLLYAQRRLSLLKSLKSPDDELEALDKVIELSPPEDLRPYFSSYQAIDDSLQTARNKAKNQFALIRYETEKSKADNLELVRDNVQLQLIIGLVISVAVIGFIYNRKRRQKIQAAADIAIRDNQLKTSQKVHDVVANGLYRIMTEVEHNEALEKEILLDKIDNLYKQSRDISYEHPQAINHDFEQVVSSLTDSYRNGNTNIYVTGNNQQLWDYLSTTKRNQVEKILEELLVNMKKHSQATNVGLRFERQENHLLIYYVDNGVGLPADFKQGNGLHNTGTRIKTIGGEYTFEPTTKGLKIRISIPSDQTP